MCPFCFCTPSLYCGQQSQPGLLWEQPASCRETSVDNYHHWMAYLNHQILIKEKTVQTRRALALRNYPFVYLLNNYKTREMTAARRVKKSSVLCRPWPSIISHSEPPLRTVSYGDLETHRRSVLILYSHVWPGLKCGLQLQLCSHIPSVTRAICATTGTEVRLLSGSMLFARKLKLLTPTQGLQNSQIPADCVVATRCG